MKSPKPIAQHLSNSELFTKALIPSELRMRHVTYMGVE